MGRLAITLTSHVNGPVTLWAEDMTLIPKTRLDRKVSFASSPFSCSSVPRLAPVSHLTQQNDSQLIERGVLESLIGLHHPVLAGEVFRIPDSDHRLPQSRRQPFGSQVHSGVNRFILNPHASVGYHRCDLEVDGAFRLRRYTRC